MTAEKAAENKVELFYDVGSTNSYFALHLLKRLADKYDTRIMYQPFNLGYVFRSNNYVLMDEPKAKLSNRKRDLMRWAKRYDLPFQVPERFPVKTSPALRGALAARTWSRDKEEAFLFALFARYWEANDGRIDELDCLCDIAAEVGLDSAEFAERTQSAEVRAQLIDCTNSALDRGIFGAPSILVGGELYWGKDRMEFVEDELRAL